jgi:hypothetical protein
VRSDLMHCELVHCELVHCELVHCDLVHCRATLQMVKKLVLNRFGLRRVFDGLK